MNSQSTDKPHRILRIPELLDKTGLKKSHQQQLEQRGEFPKRIKLSERASGWLESEVDEWIAKRVAASRSSVAAA
jgi:prophage regulatory protein